MKGFIEEDCTMDFKGQQFTSGGSFLIPNPRTGRLVGILYHFSDGNVGTWHGDRKAFAKWGRIWHDNFGGVRQSCQIIWEVDGKQVLLSGTWYQSSGDVIRVREIKQKES